MFLLKFCCLTAILATISFIVALSFGCAADSVNTVENTNKSMTPTIVPDKRVVTDSSLSKSLHISDVQSQTTKDGLLKVQVRMKSYKIGWFSDNSPYSIIYRFTWFDKDGIELSIPEEDRWKDKSVLPGDELWINSTAPKKECKDFILRIKPVN